MLHKQGKKLYTGVSDVVKEHLQNEVGVVMATVILYIYLLLCVVCDGWNYIVM